MVASELRQLLTSLQFSDSAFPSGFYTMSHGLEGYSQAQLVARGDVKNLLADLLAHSVGPGDATALAVAHRAAQWRDWDAVQEVDERLFASKLNAEMRRASVRSGHQLTDLAREVIEESQGVGEIDGAGSLDGVGSIDDYARRVSARSTPGCQPVATAVIYAALGVTTERAVASDLFAFAVSFVGAALRLRLTDHRQAQVVLHAIAPDIERAALDAVARDLDDLGGCAPVADIMSAQHERAEARLFAS
ncbi:urease accessory protein UreF [Salinibacterium hongtaonis]|uniref:urease accessory protein UreF n=1 Tax=Homoserinimonas hongtaonis TaxID=2079791 RepID=UPI000D35F4FC|nr:urease accessory UreF family protein [Salinibacterium hongtaonis]AWB88964.1 urease accessory protein [Salinibacterium hongtaonis]